MNKGQTAFSDRWSVDTPVRSFLLSVPSIGVAHSAFNRSSPPLLDMGTVPVLRLSQFPTRTRLRSNFTREDSPWYWNHSSRIQGFYTRARLLTGVTHREPRYLKLSTEHLKLPGMDSLLKIKSPLHFRFCKRRPDSCLGCQGRVSYAEFRKELYKERHKEMTQIVANCLSDFSRGLQWITVNELFVAFAVYRSSWSQRKFSCLSADNYSMAGLWCLSI